MTIHVDMQLPPRLCPWLKQHAHTAIHASELPGGTTLPDAALWEYARRDGWVIESKESDFVDLLLLRAGAIVRVSGVRCRVPRASCQV